jgi:hypothetical protein
MGKPLTDYPLSEKAQKFVAAMLADPTGSQTDAAIRAGYKPRSAAVTASRLMDDPRIAALIVKKRDDILERLDLKAEDVLYDLLHVIRADARDLVEWHVGACRYCYGEGHQYQRTPQEYRDALKAYRETDAGKADALALGFDHCGGIGYSNKRPPCPTCPECFGDGEGRQVLKDTRQLNPAAAVLYAGVETTKNGLKMNTRDKDRARDLASRALGMVKTGPLEVVGKGGGPVQHAGTVAAVALTTTDPLEAAQQYQKLMAG